MDMRDLLKQLDSIGSEITEESIAEAHGNELLKKVVNQIKQDADEQRFHEIDELLKDVPAEALQSYLSNADAERFLAGTDKAGNKITQAAKVEAVGDGAEPFYKLQDEFCGGECSSNAHRALIDEIVRYLTSDQIADFVDHFRRHYDMNEGVLESDEDINEAMVSLDQGREYFFKRHDFGDENIAYEFNKLAKRMSPEDAEMLKKELLDMYGDDVGLDEGTVSEADHSKFPKVYNDDGELVANDPATALELIADEISEQDHEAYIAAISVGDYGSLLDALDGFGYNMGTGESVEETVEVAVDDLRSLLDLAGLSPQKTTQATTELGEYANSPDEDYQDTDVQLNKMSGGLNGPKGQHKKEYPGDNPLAAELAEKLKAMLEK